ncbi:MAG: ADP-ribose pyrophosphatase [Betaproteobacteria bacterium ADurb.Bin341]|nr:MAG: ADP-ribose pyrophosphatase [Betaproteobacteria bacterium ADurb.Bin341]
MNPDGHLHEEKIDGEVVFEGRLLQVRRDRVRLPNGAESTREFVTHPGAVTMLALLDNGNLLLERQFRYPLGRVFLELPAGKIDAGETPMEAARRELLEETGYVAEDWQRLGVIHNCIGYSNEFIDIYLARRLRRVSGQQLDHNEFLEVVEMSPQELGAAIRKGEVTDAKTISGLYWLEKILA